MTVMTDNVMPRHTIGVIAATTMALIAFALAPVAQEYPLAVISILAILFVQAFLPACRLCFEAPLCPANIAQGFYWVQLVLTTVLIGYFGFSLGTLPHLPSKDAINMAIVIHVIGYLSFCAAYQWFSVRASVTTVVTDKGEMGGTTWLIISFAVLGVVGLVLTYGSVSGFIEYVSSPLQHRQNEFEPTTLASAAGNFLRHFLGFAIVLAWSVWLGRQETRNNMRFAGITAAVAVLLLVVNFTYNRGAMLAPILALVAAYSVHVSRIPFRGALFAGGVVLAGAFTFGWYRSTDLDVSELSTSHLDETWDTDSVVAFVQVYASAPQLPGYLIERLDQERKFYWGQTLLPSVVYPIPVLGKPYRDSSGVVIFNGLIYGDPDTLDQIIPLDAELYMNFHFPGIVFGNLCLGWLLCCFQRWFLSAPHAVESYAWLLLALWTIFPGSLSVASQVYVYSFWPIYGYLLIKTLGRRRTRNAWHESSMSEPKAATVLTS